MVTNNPEMYRYNDNVELVLCTVKIEVNQVNPDIKTKTGNNRHPTKTGNIVRTFPKKTNVTSSAPAPQLAPDVSRIKKMIIYDKVNINHNRYRNALVRN